MRRVLFFLLIAGILAAAAALRPGALDFTAETRQAAEALPHATSAEDRGVIQFAYGDWGALSNHTMEVSAVPWKLTTAALALAEAGTPDATPDVDLAATFRQWGIHSPERIANWPEHIPQPTRDAPLGQITGVGRAAWPPIEVTAGNAVCAVCHSSVTYGADGTPDTTQVWLGMPNTSINLEGYTQAVFAALKAAPDDAALMAAVMAMYPDTSMRERTTLRYAILPRLRGVVAERDAQYGAFLPFQLSTNGATNGLDSLRRRLDLIPEGEVVTASTFNSIPDLQHRLLRRRLLLSGSYALPDPDTAMTPASINDSSREALAAMIGYFTVPAMGVTPDVAEAHQPEALDVVAWLETYSAQPYPAPINMNLAAEGADVYAQNCASCHGTYSDDLTLTSFPNWHGDVGTDPERARLVSPEFVAAANDTLYGAYRAVETDGYSAPPLTGIWASGPYLHNGAVPTLWHLMRPEDRPATFPVGGHRIDMERVGIDITPPQGFTPWATPGIVDTASFGMSAAGHEVGFEGLTDAEKDALLEYLKQL